MNNSCRINNWLIGLYPAIYLQLAYLALPKLLRSVVAGTCPMVR